MSYVRYNLLKGNLLNARSRWHEKHDGDMIYKLSALSAGTNFTTP